MDSSTRLKKTPISDAAFQALFIITICVLLVLFFRSSLNYPYYFIYDMDQVTAVDTVLINSGSLPDHINHTGFGMYLLLSASSRIARALNIVSASNLNDLDHSLNPLAGMAELTEFLRLHSPALILVVVLTLWFSLRLLFLLPRGLALLALFVLGFQESLFYHATLIRTDFYSVFFYCVALLLLVLATRSKRHGLLLFLIFLAGVLLGLSFLTKIQSLFFIAAFPFFLALFFSIPSDRPAPFLPTVRLRMLSLVASLAGFVIFTILVVLAYQTFIPQGYGTYTGTYGFTLLAAVSMAAMAFLFLGQLVLLFSPKLRERFFIPATALTLLASGFVGSLFLHLVLYGDYHGMQYLLYDFKAVFFRPASYSLSGEESFAALYNLSRYSPWLFYVHFIFLATLVLGRSKGIIQISMRQVLLCVALTLFTVLHVFFATRFILRDLLWVEIFFNFLTLVYASLIISHLAGGVRLVHSVVYVCLAALIAGNLLHIRTIGNRTDANYNVMGWSRSWWVLETLFHHNNQDKYKFLMRSKYTPDASKAAIWNSDNFAANRRLAGFVFQNQTITQRNLGIVSKDFPVSVDKPEYRIASVPAMLSESILVDSASAHRKNQVFYWPQLVTARSEELDKFRRVTDPRLVSILPRHDLRIFLFVEKRDLNKIDFEKPDPNSPIITLRKGNETLETQGVELTGYREIPVTDFSGVYFFVILRTGV